MKTCAFIPNFLKFYNIMWQVALPFLKKNQRLAPTFDRRLTPDGYERADIWIQAASAGEALLAGAIVKELAPTKKKRILITTSTSQGMAVLKTAMAMAKKNKRISPFCHIRLDWFPFDCPDAIGPIVQRVNPKCMVMLETEIWPALFYFLKQSSSVLMILNARMSRKSFRHYGLTRGLWSCLAPDRVLAISRADAKKYQTIFPGSRVGVMPNIKFESILRHSKKETGIPELASRLPGDLKLAVLASVRRQEESLVGQMIQRLLEQYPGQAIALFPRHMHRIHAWEKRLNRMGCRFFLRSDLEERSALNPGEIILWDRFGEMSQAFGMASTVFVGGSLKRLGGQNFMEPLIHGIPTVVGPHTEDFAWVGKTLFTHNIVQRARSWQEVAQTMISHLKTPPDHRSLAMAAQDHVDRAQGGTRAAARAILNHC